MPVCYRRAALWLGGHCGLLYASLSRSPTLQTRLRKEGDSTYIDQLDWLWSEETPILHIQARDPTSSTTTSMTITTGLPYHAVYLSISTTLHVFSVITTLRVLQGHPRNSPRTFLRKCFYLEEPWITKTKICIHPWR